MDIIFGGNIKKKIIIVAVSATLFLLIFPIIVKFYEGSLSSQVITNYGYEGVASFEGGNNYVGISTLENTEKLKTEMEDSGLWYTSIESSNEAQIIWYETISNKMEKTYIMGTESKEDISSDIYTRMHQNYLHTNNCVREYASDYSGDECDYNGPVENNPNLTTYDQTKTQTCKNGDVVYPSYISSNRLYYKSEMTKKVVGGKILGTSPDVLVTSTLANTYSALDQNNVLGFQIQGEIEDLESYIQKYAGFLGSQGIATILGIISNLGAKLMDWYRSFDNVAAASSALEDIFSEGSLYSTFVFAPESTCKADDLIWYVEVGEIPKGYSCNTAETIYTKCIPYTYACDNEDEDTLPNNTCESSKKGNPIDTDGKGETTDAVPYPGPNSYYVDTNGAKHCLYKTGNDGKKYMLDVKWICNVETPVKDIKCTSVTPVKDEEDTIQYYLCSGINENEVRTKIVDPVLDAYENNELKFNEYMTKETVNKFIYGFDEEKYKDVINPENYKFDEEIRTIITKHIVMEILGGTEGRYRSAIADKDGNFYLQSVNRVLNEEQYQDALKQTIFVKDNILYEKGEITKDTPEDEKLVKLYSKKLYGSFYSEANPEFADWTEEKIEAQKLKDITTKQSQIMEIFSTYQYVTYYMKEHGAKGSRTSGTGLAQADASGYQQRTSAPCYTNPSNPTCDNEFYHLGSFIGECPWYAKGRVNEILATSGSSYVWYDEPDGGSWCESEQAKDFVISYDYNTPKKGSIVVWKKPGDHGHVAIVEDVTDTTVTISETYIRLGAYGDNARTYIYPYGDGTKAAKNCAGNGSGCWQTRPLSYEEMKNAGWGHLGYTFGCYIYLLKEEEPTNPGNDDPIFDDDSPPVEPKGYMNLTSNFKNPIVIFNQQNSGYKSKKYSANCSLYGCGCGAMSAATVISSLKNEIVTPEQVVSKSCTYGLCTDQGTGINYDWAIKVGKDWGLKVTATTDPNEVLTKLQSGNALVTCTQAGKSFLTPAGGHWIVLTGADSQRNVTIGDSWYNGLGGFQNNNSQSYSMDIVIAGNAFGYYYIYE